MRFHSAGRSLRWGADDECIVRLISASKKCGGYGHQRCACACLCVVWVSLMLWGLESVYTVTLWECLFPVEDKKKKVMIKVSGR